MPVYNDEEHIEESLNSISKQTLDNLEVICINDGSTDSSLSIIEKFHDSNFTLQIINQENCGSGIARNNGMDIARGEYIAFLDADDIFVDEVALERMYNIAISLNANMVSANLKGITIDGQLVNNDNLTRFTEEKVIPPEDYEIPYSFYKNIFKRSFIDEHNFRFPDLKRGQDPVFLADILTNVSTIPVVPVDLYGFRYAAIGGLNKINTPEKKFDYVKHFKDTFDILNNAGFTKMAEIYEEKLDYYLKSSNNGSDIEIYDAVKDIFKNDQHILNRVSKFFSIKDIKISVIIPVYNAETFMKESINSILNQTLTDIELICVNDGSTDNSLNMLNEFAKNDSRVKVIDKENGGCGSARNKSLDNATGEYIYFFDPDDYVLPDAFEKLYENAVNNDSDLVMFKIARFRDGEPINYSIPGFDFENVFKDIDFNNFTFNYKDIKSYVLNSSFAPWSKLYKKEFLDRFDNFRFDLGVAFDDVPFHVKSILRASKISFVPEFFYHYRLSNPNSVNNTKSNQIDIFKICDLVESFLKEENYFEEFEKEFYEFKIKQVLNYIISCNFNEYYLLAKKEFLKIDIRNLNINPQLLNEYFLVINSDSYDDLRIKKGAKPLNDMVIETPKISVIIPVYNAEKYISQCLDSIINQTFKDIEIICIDDGSSDESWKILRMYANKDNRVKIFTKKNGGAGSARNVGLNKARGEFINFIDSDDWINLNTLEICYNKTKQDQLDMLMFLLINYDDSTGEWYETEYYNISCIPSKFDGVIFNYNDVSDAIFHIAVSPCNKLIKKNLFDKLNYRFHEGVMFEDNPFFFKLFLNSERVSIIREHLYYRRRREDSVMANNGLKLKDNMAMTTEVVNVFRDEELLEKYKRSLTNFKLFNIRTYYRNIDTKYKDSFFEEMKRDFKHIDSQEDLSVLFRKNLYSDTLRFFTGVLLADTYKEFDLIMNIFYKDLEINKLKKIIDEKNNQKEVEKIVIDKSKENTNVDSVIEYNDILLQLTKQLYLSSKRKDEKINFLIKQNNHLKKINENKNEMFLKKLTKYF